MSVDDMVDAVMTRLTELGEADNTLAVFTSDNGFMWGDHGLREKYFPYTNSITVPFLVRWPHKVSGGVVDNRLVNNVDITPSFLDAAGISLPLKYPFDGRPFLDTSGLVSQTRSEVYIEYYKDDNLPSLPRWSSVRTTTFQYIEYYTESGGRIL